MAPDHARIDDDLRWLDAPAARCCRRPPPLPGLLRQSPDAPAVLYLAAIRGAGRAAARDGGQPQSHGGGRATAREFAALFAARGLRITSGLALGIDAACHEGALDADGLTIGVLGMRLDEMYPARTSCWPSRIAASGAWFPSSPPARRPDAPFPRAIASSPGFAGHPGRRGARDSGSLITHASLARPARGLRHPGSIHNPVARGCHELIRQGAKLVEGVEDVLSELKISLCHQLLVLPPTDAPGTPRVAPLLDKEYKILLDALAFEPASVDSLIERTGLNSESIASMLLILELDGHVAPHPGGRYSRMAGQ
jgi:DNA processing protein